MMRIIVFSLLILCSINILARGSDHESVIPIQISRIFDEENSISVTNLLDYIDKEEKIDKCVAEYIDKQSKSYAKIVKNNLYDLIHNFDRIVSKIYGKKSVADEIPYDEKVEALAVVQCEAYYKMGVLK